ncbi:hypothetical protein FOA52_013311 [Chlamydomonas sp. UWO 241]|nr:hypothetical protein FOA52_013311 [Chlamydomonas sp. UWO 241]
MASASADNSAFLGWLRARGGFVHADVSLFSHLPEDDRGVVANANIAKGENLVIVPCNACLSLPSDGEEAAAEGAPAAAAHLASQPASPFLGSVLLLMAELAAGEKSGHRPYLSALPGSVNCVLGWSDAERAELKGTTIEDSTSPSDVYERDVKPRLLARPDLWPAPHATLEEFLRVAGLVQSRAFHMESENWVTGTRTSGTRLYLIPAIDMINHSTDPARRNTSLHKFDTRMEVEVDGKTIAFDSFFAMKADRDIVAGEQVLHTYGDLADAQLLHTYGFVDLGPGGDTGPGTAPPLTNPHDYVTVAVRDVAAACRSALNKAVEGDKKEMRDFDATLEAKLALLATSHVLAAPPSADAADAPAAAAAAGGAGGEFALTRRTPLPDGLLTALQVLLMSSEELEELQAEYADQAAVAASAGAGASDSKSSKAKAKFKGKKGKQAQKKEEEGSTATASPAEPEPLSLGTELLEQDEGFAQVVAMALMQIVDAAMVRYPTSPKDDAKTLKHPPPGGEGGVRADRLRLATLVRLGEKDVLQLLKKAAVMIMMGVLPGQDAADEAAAPAAVGAPAAGKKKRKGGGAEEGGAGRPGAKKAKKGGGGAGAPAKAGGGTTKKGGAGSVAKGAASATKGGADGATTKQGAKGAKGAKGKAGKPATPADEAKAAKAAEAEEERELLQSDDSDKVGYGDVDFDDGIGEAHDRLKPHAAPRD